MQRAINKAPLHYSLVLIAREYYANKKEYFAIYQPTDDEPRMKAFRESEESASDKQCLSCKILAKNCPDHLPPEENPRDKILKLILENSDLIKECFFDGRDCFTWEDAAGQKKLDCTESIWSEGVVSIFSNAYAPKSLDPVAPHIPDKRHYADIPHYSWKIDKTSHALIKSAKK